jgi:hypothetical protein
MTPASLDAVRQVLPAWVIWLPVAAALLAAPIAYGLAAIGAHVAAGGLRRLDPEAHPAERAQHVVVFRLASLLVVVLAVLATVPLAVGGPVSVGKGTSLVLVLVIAFLCAVAAVAGESRRWADRPPADVRARGLAALVRLAPAAIAYVASALGWRRGGAALEATDGEPTAPPSPVPAIATVAFLAFLFVVGLLLARVVITNRAHDERTYLVAIAIRGRADDLGGLGRARYERNAFAEAAPLFHAAAELQSTEPNWPAWEAITLARAGRCQEASLALGAASALSKGAPAIIESPQLVLSTCVPR